MGLLVVFLLLEINLIRVRMIVSSDAYDLCSTLLKYFDEHQMQICNVCLLVLKNQL